MSSQALLKRLIELAGGPADHGYVLALMSDTLKEVPSAFATNAARYTVVHPTTELGLRHTLWRAKGAPILALVDEPLARRLPADLVLASRGARVHAVETSEVLSLALKTQVQAGDDEALQKLALEHVDQLTDLLSQRTLPTVVDQALLDELIADALFKEEVRKLTAPKIFARWLLHPPTWKPAELDLLQRQLPRLFALEGRLLAWALKDPKRPEALLVHGTLLALEESELPRAAWGELFDAGQSVELSMTRETLRHTVRAFVRATLDQLKGDAARFLDKADALARKTVNPSVHAKSRDLPLGLKNRAEEVAVAAERGEAISHDAIQEMRRHRSAPTKKSDLDVLEEVARLSRYLATTAPAEASVLASVRHHQRHGAYADLAASRLRAAMAASVAHKQAVAHVLTRYRDRRNAENLAFGELLSANYSASLHTDGVVPLHKIWRSAPARAEGSKPYDLFLIVLDGCSYSVFLRLLNELASETESYGLRADAAGEAHGVPALAPLPTITSHARSAIFLGEIPQDPFLSETVWRDQKEAVTDPARFKQNTVLGKRPRKLFLKGQLADHGHALLAALDDPSLEIVAVVFNAVDDQIGSSNTGAQISVRAKEIAAFVPSVERAIAAGRRVVITADHGHTPFWGKEHRAGDAGSARYRILSDKDPVPDGFLELGGDDLSHPPGRKAFAWRLGAYLGQPQVGFHGGCSLEEMVVPLAEIVKGGVAADEPGWWYGGAASARTPEPPPVELDPLPGAAAAPSPAAKKPVQGDLFNPDDYARTASEEIAMPEGVRRALDAAELAALGCIFKNNGARVSDIARILKRTPPRVSGLLSRLVQKLHETGYPCVKKEAMPDGDDRYLYVPQAAVKA